MVSKEYLERLSGYVAQERDRLGSLSKLRSRFERVSGESLSDETVRKWLERRVGKEGLRGKSLQILAAYRGETAEETLAWLEGRVGNSPKISELEAIAAIRAAPLSALPECLELIAQRLSFAISSSTESPMNFLADLIRDELLRAGHDPSDRASIQHLINSVPDLWQEPEKVEQLWQITQGLLVVDSEDFIVPDIAATLNQFSGRPDDFEIAEIKAGMKKARRTNGNGHPNGKVAR